MPVDRGVKRELNTMTEISCPGRSWNGFEHEYEVCTAFHISNDLTKISLSGTYAAESWKFPMF